jgi:UbiA prenyltransferase family
MTMTPERRELTLAHELIREARPKQWIKNLLVFAAPGAAGVLDNGPALWRTIVTFVALCLAASGTYFLNDVADVEADRQHPTKRNRPVAAGTIPLPLATAVGIGLLLGSLVVAASTARWQVALVVALYIALTLAYSVWLKHIAVVDIVTVATGFVLRAIAGAVAVDVPMSNWFLICISFGSLFIVTGKRYAELLEFGDDALQRHLPPVRPRRGGIGHPAVVLPVGVREGTPGRHLVAHVPAVDRADGHGLAALRARAGSRPRRRTRGGLPVRSRPAGTGAHLGRDVRARRLPCLTSWPPTAACSPVGAAPRPRRHVSSRCTTTPT